MALSKMRLILNIALIIIAIIVALMMYPSQVAKFLIMLASLASFVTLEQIFKPKRTYLITIVGIVLLAIFFISIYS